jgi:hypothetical protein
VQNIFLNNEIDREGVLLCKIYRYLLFSCTAVHVENLTVLVNSRN